LNILNTIRRSWDFVWLARGCCGNYPFRDLFGAQRACKKWGGHRAVEVRRFSEAQGLMVKFKG
jgi:hypothetical protein